MTWPAREPPLRSSKPSLVLLFLYQNCYFGQSTGMFLDP